MDFFATPSWDIDTILLMLFIPLRNFDEIFLMKYFICMFWSLMTNTEDLAGFSNLKQPKKVYL